MKQIWPAPERNKAPILEVLRRVLPASGTVLELASGTGQHVCHFAEALPGLSFQPSDPDPQNRASIEALRTETGLSNVREALALDARDAPWPLDDVDAIFNANMIHITPWACTEGLLAGASRHLRTRGLLVMYGPYRIGGQHTAESNAAFDASLRARDSSWGVRDLEAVVELALSRDISLVERVQMPANNQLLIFRRG
jgi:SAM-dependent methyltransferase